MHIHNKYDYQPLSRIDAPTGRKYVVGETKLPSVTTILSATDDKTHLDQWIANVGVVEATRVRDEASMLGTAMHQNLENYILEKPMSGMLMSKVLAKVIIKEGLVNVNEVWGTEVALFTKDLYAGTTDLIGLHNGIPAIMDFKNSLNDKHREWIDNYFMQLCAYAISHNEMYGTSIAKGVVMIATRAGKYQEFIIEGDEFAQYEIMWANKVCKYYEQYSNE